MNLHNILQPALRSFQTNWRPMVSIQLIALSLVVLYYSVEGARATFENIAQFKEQSGLWFAVIATIISGGILPELVKRIFRPKRSQAPSIGEFLHQLGYWALIGILVDRFYQFQATLFGHGIDAVTLFSKMLVDQFLFTPLVSMPLTVLWFLLWEVRYQPRAFLSQAKLSLILERMLPVYAVVLSFWPAMLLVIYSLPQLLQFPLFQLGNAAYSILMIFVIRRLASSVQD